MQTQANMKTILLQLLWIIASTISSHAQQSVPTKDEVAFEQAAEAFEKERYKEAQADWLQFMKQHPDSPLLGRAHYNLGLTWFHMKEYEKAAEVFLEILNQPYNEKDANSLMEPYTLYKHHSCRLLAEMNLKQKKFDEAEKYILLFDKKYPYQHFCGNEWSSYHKYYAIMLAQVYEGTNRFSQAIGLLVPHVFPDFLSSDEVLIETLVTILQNHFSKAEIRKELNAAIQSLELKHTKKETTASVFLYGVKIKLDPYALEEGTTSEYERYKKMVTENKLFKKFL
jgi:tetratricopeptide (TPR) repeat protein